MFKTVMVLLALLLLVRLNQEFDRAPSYGMHGSYDSEERVNAWLLSAFCFQKTRVPLVICGPNDALYPIEDVWIGDDRGHALLLTAAAFHRTTPVTRVTLVKLNLAINAAGILLLAFIWMLAKMPCTALLTLALGMRYGLPGPIPGHDSPASYFGVFCLTALVVVWTACCSSLRLSKRRMWIGSVVAFFSLTWALLLRQPIGMMAVFCSALFLVEPCLMDKPRRPYHLKKLFVGGILILAAMSASPAILKVRNMTYGIAPSSNYHSHGIWHSLYCGIGWVSNPWGIQWNDHHTAEAVRRVNPQARYGTYDYIATIKRMYWRLWFTDPLSVVGVYVQKFVEVWNFPLLIVGTRLSIWFMLTACLGAALWRKSKGPQQHALKLILSLALLYLFFALEGVLGIPTGTHLYPAKFCVLLMIVAWADYWQDGEPFSRMRGARRAYAGKKRTPVDAE